MDGKAAYFVLRPGYVFQQIWGIFGQDFALPKQRVLLGVLGVRVEPPPSKSRTKKALDNHEVQVMWKPLFCFSTHGLQIRDFL